MAEKVRIACQACGQAYNVPADRIPAEGKKARCKICGAVFVMKPPGTKTSPPGLEGEWALRLEGEEEAGLSFQEVKNRIRYDQLFEQDEALPPGAKNWLVAGEVPVLRRYFQLKASSSGAASPSASPPPAQASTSSEAPQAGPVAAAASGAPAARPAPPAAGASSLIVCKNHQDRDADHVCADCPAYWCEECVEIKEVQRTRFAVCPTCGEAVDDVERPRHVTPFWKDLPRILSFPFHQKGIVTFFIYVGWSIMADAAGILSGIASLILWLPLLGYNLHLIRESAKGVEHPPDFPDFGDFASGLVWPAIQYFLATVVAFLPAIAWGFFWWGRNPGIMGIGVLLFILTGFVYYPMILGILAVWHSLIPSLNPILLGRLIGRIPNEYAIFLLFWFGTWVPVFIMLAVSSLIPFGFVVVNPIMGFAYFVTFHMLGRMFYQCEDKLAWE